MPKIFDAFAAAGQGIQGAQDYYQNKGALEAQQLAISEAKRRAVELAAQDQRDEQYRQGTADAISALGEMQRIDSEQFQGSDQLAGVSTPIGAMVGAGRTLAEVQAFMRSKNDAIAGQLDKLRESATRVARAGEPEAAMALIQAEGQRIQQQVMQKAQADFMQQGSTKIQKIGQLGATGRLPEEAAAQFADSIQSIMEIVEQDPSKMAWGADQLSKINAAASDALKQQDDEMRAMQKLDWLQSDPAGFDKEKIDEAKRRVELGEKPTETLAWLRTQQNDDWHGGLLSTAPVRLRQSWEAQASKDAREFVAKHSERAPGESPTDYVRRVMQEAQDLVPQFLDETYKANGVIRDTGRPPRSYLQAQAGGGKPSLDDVVEGRGLPAGGGLGMKVPATASAFPGMSGPQPGSASPEAAALAGAEAGAAKPRSPELEKLLAKPPKRRKNEDVGTFVARAQNMVQGRGGGEEELIQILEANGITPEMVLEAQY